jgi:hypothetical protein
VKREKHDTHRPPVTRREFLASGAIGFSATMFAPTLFSSLFATREALASGCPDSGGPDPRMVPYLVFDLAGGASLSGNFLVGKQGGPEDLLRSYSTLGWNPRDQGALDKTFGLPMSARMSQMLVGMKQTMSAQAQAVLRMGSICTISADDTSRNPSSAVTLVSKSGYQGSLMPGGLGTTSNNSGGNSDVAMTDLTLKPLFVSSLNDVLGSISYGPAFAKFNTKQLTALGKATLKLSQEQAKKIAQMPMGQQLSTLTECGLQKNLGYASGVTGVDPRQDQVFQSVYGINANTGVGDANAIFAAIVMNCLKGNSGPGVITLGGYDYHDGTQTTGDQKDLEAGQQIGRAVEASFRMGKPLFFHILSDGSVGSKENTRIWTTESQERSLGIMGYMNPRGAPRQRKLQVGHYTDGQGVERDTLIGTEPAKSAYAVFANYLNVCGRLSEFETWAPRGLFTPEQLDSLMIYG